MTGHELKWLEEEWFKHFQEPDVGQVRPKPMKSIACFRPSSRSREEAREYAMPFGGLGGRAQATVPGDSGSDSTAASARDGAEVSGSGGNLGNRADRRGGVLTPA